MLPEPELLISTGVVYSSSAIAGACKHALLETDSNATAAVVTLCAVVAHVPVPTDMHDARVLYPARLCGYALLVALAEVVKEEDGPRVPEVHGSMPAVIAVVRRAKAAANAWFAAAAGTDLFGTININMDAVPESAVSGVQVFSQAGKDAGMGIHFTCSAAFARAFLRRLHTDSASLSRKVYEVLFAKPCECDWEMFKEVRVGVALAEDVPMHVAETHCASACRTVTLCEAARIAMTRFTKPAAAERCATLTAGKGLDMDATRLSAHGDWKLLD